MGGGCAYEAPLGGVGVVDVDRLRAWPFGGGRVGVVSVGDDADLCVGLERSLPLGERRGFSEWPRAGERDESIGGGEVPFGRPLDDQLDGFGDGGLGDGEGVLRATARTAAEAEVDGRLGFKASAYDVDCGERILWSPCARGNTDQDTEGVRVREPQRGRARGDAHSKGDAKKAGEVAVGRHARLGAFDIVGGSGVARPVPGSLSARAGVAGEQNRERTLMAFGIGLRDHFGQCADGLDESARRRNATNKAGCAHTRGLSTHLCALS